MTPDQPPDPVAVALAFAAVFEGLGIPYVAAGSLASSLHGEPRSTVDIDLVADLRSAHVGPLLAALEGDYYVSEEAVRDALRFGTSFNAIHLATAVKARGRHGLGDRGEGKQERRPVLGDGHPDPGNPE